MYKVRRIFFPLIISTLLSACSSGPAPETQVNASLPVNQLLSDNQDLFQFFNEWEGTPYRLGGTKKSGIDCSAFVQKPLSRHTKCHYREQRANSLSKVLR